VIPLSLQMDGERTGVLEGEVTEVTDVFLVFANPAGEKNLAVLDGDGDCDILGRLDKRVSGLFPCDGRIFLSEAGMSISGKIGDFAAFSSELSFFSSFSSSSTDCK